jgi:hypothetical protein
MGLGTFGRSLKRPERIYVNIATVAALEISILIKEVLTWPNIGQLTAKIGI